MNGDILVAVGQEGDGDAVALGAWLASALNLESRVLEAGDSPEAFRDDLVGRRPELVVFGPSADAGHGSADVNPHARCAIDDGRLTVALAPRDYARRADRFPKLIGAAFAGDEIAGRVLDAASRITKSTGSTLIAICVGDTETRDFRETGCESITEALVRKDEDARRAMRLAADALDGHVRHEVRFARGDVARELRQAADGLDLLVVGRRCGAHLPGLASMDDMVETVAGMHTAVLIVDGVEHTPETIFDKELRATHLPGAGPSQHRGPADAVPHASAHTGPAG